MSKIAGWLALVIIVVLVVLAESMKSNPMAKLFWWGAAIVAVLGAINFHRQG